MLLNTHRHTQPKKQVAQRPPCGEHWAEVPGPVRTQVHSATLGTLALGIAAIFSWALACRPQTQSAWDWILALLLLIV